MNYQSRLDLYETYNAQRTLERFGYLYPTRPKEKVSLNCANCKKEGQLTVNGFLSKKKTYLCRSCGALQREAVRYNINWEERCKTIEGYDSVKTEDMYGYKYPQRSNDLVCVRCECQIESHQPIIEFWRRKKRYQCKICISKQEFSKRKENMFAARDKFWSKDENRKWASDLAKTQEHRKTVMEKNNQNLDFQKKRRAGYAKNETEIKQKQSEASKNMWAERYDEMCQHTKETAPLRAEKLKARMEDPVVRSHYSNKAKETWENPEYVKKQKKAWTEERKEALRERNKSPEMLAKVNTRVNTTEEVLLRYFFESLGIKVIPSHTIKYYVFDLYLPSLNILIEFDGLRWHHPDYVEGNAKSNIARDKSKTTYIQKYHPELTLIRINENALYQKGYLESKFQHLLKEQTFSFKDVSIQEVDNKTALIFLTLFHYKENQRAAPGMKIGAYLDGKLIGLAVYSSVSRQEIATSMGCKPKEILELSRFCIHPNYHKNNFGSWLLAQSRESIKKEYPYVRGIVTFADTTLDHQGTIYKAAGYSFVSEVSEDYHYRHKDTGHFMHKRTLWGLAKKMREPEIIYAEKHGFKKEWGAKKLKFFYSF